MLTPLKAIPLRIRGVIEAGFPSPAEEELSDTLTLDDWLMENREATIMLKAPNDSMIGAGIVAGDLMLLDRSRTPKDGDIVLAEIDRVSTMRYLRKRGNRAWLEAAHPHYKPLMPQEKLTVTAVVVAVIRKYY
jgi:SOS-response transcriptional repressor LexA